MLSRIDQLVRKYGDYMAALVLMIMAIKALVHLSVLLMAYLQGGTAMALAILLTTCCGASNTLKKIKRRQQRTKDEVPMREETQTAVPLIAVTPASAPALGRPPVTYQPQAQKTSLFAGF